MSENDFVPGHLFVLHGRIENFAYDAVIVPTDSVFTVEPHWRPVAGDVDRARPAGWPAPPFGRAATGESVWFISVADAQLLTADELVRRMRETLRQIDSADIAKPAGRALRRVALPVLGIGAGGLGARRGAILRELLAALREEAATLGLDILLVTPDAAVFSAAQHARRNLAAGGTRHWELDDREMAEARRLGGLAAQGHLALFLGAGVSMAAGLPSWGDLIKNLGERVEGGLPKDFDGLDALDQAEFLATRLGGAQELNQAVIEIIGRSGKIALAHALLAGMGCGHAVTTNYDNLYERAVEATGRTRPSVLPWESVEEGRPWLLKLHGDIDRTPSIVLTRRDFVLFDAKSRPAGSLLQALLLTKHVLIIGASLSDGNVIRLAMEVDEYLQKSEARSIRGTFVDTSGVEARQELWRDQFRWFVCEGKERENRVRRMEMFLDAVAAYAATDAPWLLDERFDGLLDDRDRGVVKLARELAEKADDASGLLDPLKHSLSSLGARRNYR